MIILGIETSCDETALALIKTRTSPEGAFEVHIIDSLVHSQAELHSAYGGVYPNLAKREHGKNLAPLLHKLLTQSAGAIKTSSASSKSPTSTGAIEFTAKLESFKSDLQGQNPDLWESLAHAEFLKDVPVIDRIAVTEGPGLEPALWVGISFAEVLGKLWNITVIPVNHMEGHIVGSLLASDAIRGEWQELKPLNLPALALLISGGHTELVKIEQLGNYEIIGQTKDDAVGEAFDKAARLLGLPYPGGPHMSKLAHEAVEKGIVSPVKLPRPMIASGDLDFSFSGLKTAVLYAVRANAKSDGSLATEFKLGLAREFQEAVRDTLDAKLRAALDSSGAKTLIVGGGVAANEMLRDRFTDIAHEYGIPLYLPSRHISGDNALMIALAGALDAKVYAKPLRADGTKRLA